MRVLAGERSFIHAAIKNNIEWKEKWVSKFEWESQRISYALLEKKPMNQGWNRTFSTDSHAMSWHATTHTWLPDVKMGVKHISALWWPVLEIILVHYTKVLACEFLECLAHLGQPVQVLCPKYPLLNIPWAPFHGIWWGGRPEVFSYVVKLMSLHLSLFFTFLCYCGHFPGTTNSCGCQVSSVCHPMIFKVSIRTTMPQPHWKTSQLFDHKHTQGCHMD